jgi:hypothetical protein
MNISIASEGLSANERGDFQLVCRLYEMGSADFEALVEHEHAAGSGRAGRKLVRVLCRLSGRHRTYRAGAGNDWVTAFEEDVRAHCFMPLFQKPSFGGRGHSGVHASGF